MSTPKTPSKPRTKKATATDATPATDVTLAEAAPAKKPARKRAAKAEAPEATPVEAAATPVASEEVRTDRRAEIRRRAYALYRAGSRDTFANWIQAERETLGR